MGLRDTLQKPVVGATVALLFLAGAGALLFMRGSFGAKAPSGEAWYYDTGSGKVFPAKNEVPPIAAPSGSEGVRAMIFSCGACEAGKWTIAYLETLTPEAKAVLAKPSDSPEPMEARNRAMTTGRLVALPPEGVSGKPDWVPSNAPQAAAILARARITCPDPKQNPRTCAP